MFCHIHKHWSGNQSKKITLERLLEWRTSLQDEYAEATVAGHVKKIKAVLNWAVDQDWRFEMSFGITTVALEGRRLGAKSFFGSFAENGTAYQSCNSACTIV